MKLTSLVATIAFSTLAPTFGITEADITPAALVGKTLTFTIVNGGAPYPTNGTWTGSFAGSGNSFTVANISGDTAPITTTYSAAIDGMFTDVSLAKFIEGQAPANLSLFILEGAARYEVVINGVFGVSLNGTFTIGPSVPPNAPEIDVQQPKGKSLVDGRTSKSFGRVKTGRPGVTKTFIIKNTGDAPLTGISLSKSGSGKKDFTFSAPLKTSLAAGKSTTFTVTFEPKTPGAKSAFIKVKNNDKNENPFDIPVTGTGVKFSPVIDRLGLP